MYCDLEIKKRKNHNFSNPKKIIFFFCLYNIKMDTNSEIKHKNNITLNDIPC